jgi:hypothetical protein
LASRHAAPFEIEGKPMNKRQRLAVMIYIALTLLCASMFVLAEFVGPSVRESLRPVAAEGFRTVLTAFIGALSVLMGSSK